MFASVAEQPRPDLAPTACFSLIAKSDPGIMPRVMQLFAKRAIVPDYWCSRLSGPELSIDLQVDGLDTDAVLYLASCFRQIPGMRTVLTSEKRRG